MNSRTYMPIADNGFDPGWLDNRTKIYRIDPDTGEQYLARIEDTEGNVIEGYTKEGDTLAKGIPANRPDIEELTQVWEEAGHSINKVKDHFNVYWGTAKEWLIEAGLIGAGFGSKKVGDKTDPPEEKRTWTLRPAPAYEELKAFAERENYKNLSNKGKKEFHTSYARMKKWLEEAGLLERHETEQLSPPEKDAFTKALENAGLTDQAINESFCQGESKVIIPGHPREEKLINDAIKQKEQEPPAINPELLKPRINQYKPIDWETLWPQAVEMINSGIEPHEVAEQLGLNWSTFRKKMRKELGSQSMNPTAKKPVLTVIKKIADVAPIAELDAFKISWISDVCDSGFTAAEKIGIIQSIIDLPGVPL